MLFTYRCLCTESTDYRQLQQREVYALSAVVWPILVNILANYSAGYTGTYIMTYASHFYLYLCYAYKK